MSWIVRICRLSSLCGCISSGIIRSRCICFSLRGGGIVLVWRDWIRVNILTIYIWVRALRISNGRPVSVLTTLWIVLLFWTVLDGGFPQGSIFEFYQKEGRFLLLLNGLFLHSFLFFRGRIFSTYRRPLYWLVFEILGKFLTSWLEFRLWIFK